MAGQAGIFRQEVQTQLQIPVKQHANSSGTACRSGGICTSREKYAAAHGDELAAYDKAYKFLLKHGAEKTGSTLKVDVSALKKERAKLTAKNEQLAENIGAIYADINDLKTVRYYISKVQPEYYSQLLLDGEKPSVKERMEIAEVKRNTQADATHRFVKEDLRE